MAKAPEAHPAPGIGRRLYRGFTFALIVGMAGAGLSGVPALFLQSIFVGEAQRCIEAIEVAEAGGDVILTCPDEFTNPPVWLPVIMVVGGAALGATGGARLRHSLAGAPSTRLYTCGRTSLAAVLSTDTARRIPRNCRR